MRWLIFRPRILLYCSRQIPSLREASYGKRSRLSARPSLSLSKLLVISCGKTSLLSPILSPSLSCHSLLFNGNTSLPSNTPSLSLSICGTKYLAEITSGLLLCGFIQVIDSTLLFLLACCIASKKYG